MISDASRYYGCVLHQIIDHAAQGATIDCLDGDAPGFYLLNGTLPFYIKYSTSRTSPWGFNFHISHQERLKNLVDKYGECIAAFVCGRDGIAAINYAELKNILDASQESQESVSIRRRRNEMYNIKGRNGVLNRKISRSSLIDMLKGLPLT